jgi:hypothetical protein
MRADPSLRLIPALLCVALLAACGNKGAAPPAATGTGAAPAAATAEDDKKDGGLFGFMDKDAPPAATPGPDLGQFQLQSVTLGNALDADHNVREAKTVFAPRDAIHAVVLSTGAHPGITLVAHWTAADGTVVAHTEQAMVPTGPTLTTFSLKNAQPWPPGMYQVAVQVGGQTLQSRAFEIAAGQ